MTPDSPAARLYREPFAFDFFQAVRLLERMHPDRKLVGRAGPPDAEAVRFVSRASLAFPAAAIDRLDPPEGDEDGPPRMAVNFFGLTGPNGVLPLVYTQWQIARERARGEPESGALAAWLDLFTHRLLSLFYRAGRKYRLPIVSETAEAYGRHDPITTACLALIGLGTPGLADRFKTEPVAGDDDSDDVEDVSLLRYAELFSHATRPAVGLEGMLTDFFDVPIAVETFRGRWLPLDPDNQTRIGRIGGNDRLGESALVGRRVWDVASGIRVRIGPLNRPEFRQWLPHFKRIYVLAKLVRFYTRDELDFDVQLVLSASAVRPLQLNRPGSGQIVARLGWNTWVLTRLPTRDVDDAVFRRGELVKAVL
jgi:type VI secretion system protein ImpH